VREYFLTLLVSAAFTYLLTPLVRRGAIMVGAEHAARDRDVHVVPIPLLGGVAMYAGLAAGLIVASQVAPLKDVFSGSPHMEAGLLLAGALLVVVGFVDDRWGLNPLSKLAGQVAAGAIVVYSGAEISWLPKPSGGTLVLTPDQSIALTILVVVATVNAVNFIDGLDGLAAGIVAIAALSFYIYYYTLTTVVGVSAEAAPALASAILAGICLGFLPHNFYPAKIFMGDTGAMLLGLLLAYVVTSSIASLDPSILSGRQAYGTGTVNRFPEILPLLLPATILVIPYADMLLAVVRRTRAGQPVFAPDRKHLHHRLLDIGHSHRSSVLIMYLWAALFSGTVVWLSIKRTHLFVFALLTVAAVLVLLLMSMPRLRFWRRNPSAVPAHASAPAGAEQSPVLAAPTPPAGRAPAAAAVSAPAGSLSAAPAPAGLAQPAPAQGRPARAEQGPPELAVSQPPELLEDRDGTGAAEAEAAIASPAARPHASLGAARRTAPAGTQPASPAGIAPPPSPPPSPSGTPPPAARTDRQGDRPADGARRAGSADNGRPAGASPTGGRPTGPPGPE
jgi:UDP-GlcNAc:undecaprenyl-phosphate GlcNAc-1-phosphate transferase